VTECESLALSVKRRGVNAGGIHLQVFAGVASGFFINVKNFF